MKKLCVSFCVFLLVLGFSFAQEQYGHLRGVVMDAGGEPIPGVSVLLESSEFGSRSVITSEKGRFRFINVSPNICRLQCELEGFRTHIQENLDIRVGTNFDLQVVMEPATLEEEVTIVAESPIVDTKKVGTAFNVTETQLQDIPSARDPWVILQQAPGIMIDQENVGGSRSGNQSGWSSKGTFTSFFGNFNMDGVNVTDMHSVGVSSRYYDFDSFSEIQIVTAGADPSIKTAGVSINMITRRGGNKYEFLGRIYYTDDKLQGDNRSQELIDQEYVGDRISVIKDYGFQLGGPIVQDRLWFWFGYGIQDIGRLTLDGYPQDTNLESFNAKLNFQISSNDRAELAFAYTDKTQIGRDASTFRPPETTTDQIGNGNPLVKFEYERVFSDNFLMGLKLAHSWGWFGYEPQGGMDTQSGYDFYTGMYMDTYDWLRNHRPSYNAQTDGNVFFENLLGGDHELKFGLEYRLTSQKSDHIWPGGVRRMFYNGEPFQARIMRFCQADVKGQRFSFYLNDAYTRGRLTLNLGMRLDRENSWTEEIYIPASEVAPLLMPALTQPPIKPDMNVWTFSPRLGLTFDITGDGKTIFRANVARYSLWPRNEANTLSTAEENMAGYYWDDLNGDDLVSTDELVGYPYEGLLYYNNFNALDPTNPESPNEISPDLRWGLTDELLFGLEREFFRDFSLGANFTLRKIHRWNWMVAFNRETGQRDSQEDWVGPYQGSTEVDGQVYNYEYWAPKTHAFELPNLVRENRPDWHWKYWGFEIIARKRLSHRWMMNASVTIQRDTEHYGEKGYFDPTNVSMYDGNDWTNTSHWMGKVNFLYQLPWGFSFAGFATVREGPAVWKYIQIYAKERAEKGIGGWTAIGVEEYGKSRLPNFYNLDISLAKEFVIGGYGRLTLQVDAFNVFNYGHTLDQIYRVNHPRYGDITQILNPRVIRFGVRYRY